MPFAAPLAEMLRKLRLAAPIVVFCTLRPVPVVVVMVLLGVMPGDDTGELDRVRRSDVAVGHLDRATTRRRVVDRASEAERAGAAVDVDRGDGRVADRPCGRNRHVCVAERDRDTRPGSLNVNEPDTLLSDNVVPLVVVSAVWVTLTPVVPALPTIAAPTALLMWTP
jgi:hypothetical protein